MSASRRPASPRQLSFAERRAAHTDEARELARAELRIAGAEHDRLKAAYKAAVDRRKRAVVAAERVGVSVTEMGADLGKDPSVASRLLANNRGERRPKG